MAARRFGGMNLLAVATLAPATLLFIAVSIVPLVWAVHASLFNINPFSQNWSYVGLKQYVEVLGSAAFWEATWRSFVFGIGSTALQLVMGIGVALALRYPFPGVAVARALAVAGYLLPPIVIALSFRWMSLSQYGVFNQILMSLGWISEPIAFFGDERYAMSMLVLTAAWQYTGFVALMVLARLQSIPERLYEAARIDGASPLRQFFDVTLPQIKGIILVVLLLRFVWMFNKFDLLYTATHGGPGTATQTLPLYIFEMAFTGFRLGAAASIAVLLFVQLIMVAVLFFLVSKPENEAPVR